MCQQVHQTVVDPLHPPGQGPGELSRRRADALRRLGLQQVGHRLGLGEVQPAVQEGPFGKLSGLRQTGPRGAEGLQSQGEHHGRAVALELRRVLPGIAVRRAGDRSQHLIHHPPLPVQKGAVHQSAAGRLSQRAAAPGAKDPVRRRCRSRPRQAEDPDGGGAQGGADRSDQVGHFAHLIIFVENVIPFPLDSLLMSPYMHIPVLHVDITRCGKPCG